MRSAVDHHPIAASAQSSATSPSRARTAVSAGPAPAGVGRRGDHAPRRTRTSRARLALVLDPERVDPRASRLGHREVRPGRVEHAGEADRLAGLDAEGHDVLDLEVDRVPTRTPWRRPSSVSSIGARSTPSTSPTSGARPAIGPPSCPPKTFASLSACSSLARSSMNIPSRQLPSVITFGVSMITTAFSPADVGAVDLALAHVEGERRAAEVVRRAVVERQVARAHQLARAGLGIAALQAPGHPAPPLDSSAAILQRTPERVNRAGGAAGPASRLGRLTGGESSARIQRLTSSRSSHDVERRGRHGAGRRFDRGSRLPDARRRCRRARSFPAGRHRDLRAFTASLRVVKKFSAAARWSASARSSE